MTERYPILDVQPEWVLQPEEMGGKEKFWFSVPEEPELEFLFKYPRKNTGEHWAEAIADQVARVLEIPHNHVRLATFQGECGTASESFVKPGQQLFHGNQILAHLMRDYDPDRRFRQSNHTLRNIWLALDLIFEEPQEQKYTFAEFLVLDALIGNTDRHHENWGVIRERKDDEWVGYLAPSFDHASSLGREFGDKRREGLLANSRIGNYSEKGVGGIYWSESDSKAPSPLELVRLAFREYPDLLTPALSKLAKLEEVDLKEIVGGIPPDWMSDAAKRFAIQLISYNCSELRELV